MDGTHPGHDEARPVERSRRAPTPEEQRHHARAAGRAIAVGLAGIVVWTVVRAVATGH